MRRMIASCWKSFSPNTATSGWTMLNSLVTTVATPAKWTGRLRPHRWVARSRTRTSVWKPGGYMSAGVGANTTATRSRRTSSMSRSKSRG